MFPSLYTHPTAIPLLQQVIVSRIELTQLPHRARRMFLVAWYVSISHPHPKSKSHVNEPERQENKTASHHPSIGEQSVKVNDE